MELSVDWGVGWFNFKSDDSFVSQFLLMKEGKCMVTSWVVCLVCLVVDIVTVERDSNTNNKVTVDVGNNSDGDRKEALSWSISDLAVLLSRIILVLYSSGDVLSDKKMILLSKSLLMFYWSTGT